MGKADRDNRSNQMNPNNDAYHSSRSGSNGDDEAEGGDRASPSLGAPAWPTEEYISLAPDPEGMRLFRKALPLLRKLEECREQMAAQKASNQRATAPGRKLGDNADHQMLELERRGLLIKSELRSFFKEHHAGLAVTVASMGYSFDEDFNMVLAPFFLGQRD